MIASQRIALNTGATYARSLVSAGLALFSSRWVLNSLGFTDYGLYSLVGSIIVFIVFLNNVMSASASRFFAYSIGAGDSSETKKWFNAAFNIHVVLAILLISIGWPLGEYLIRHYLTIPMERLDSCIWVFRLSLIAAFVSMIAVPFVALFSAKQKIVEIAIWGLLQSVLSFALAACIPYGKVDKLIFYTVGMVGIIVVLQALQIVRCRIIFPESRGLFEFGIELKKMKSIFSFASWYLIGSSGAILRDQGSAILLNIYFGPQLNAAYGIAIQVSAQSNQLASAMVGAFSPEITTSEGKGDRKRMLALSNQASKFGSLLVLAFACPLMIEMDYVLKIWLKTPPMYASEFCRLIILTFIIDRLSSGALLAVNARGKIAAYQATLGSILLLTLPISWALLKFGLAPTSIGLAFITTMILTSLGRVLWVKHIFGMNIMTWVKDVVLPNLVVFGATISTCIFVHSLMNESFVRLMLVSALGIVTYALVTYTWGISNSERANLHSFLKRITNDK